VCLKITIYNGSTDADDDDGGGGDDCWFGWSLGVGVESRVFAMYRPTAQLWYHIG
jgi:hypothetical protein